LRGRLAGAARPWYWLPSAGRRNAPRGAGVRRAGEERRHGFAAYDAPRENGTDRRPQKTPASGGCPFLASQEASDLPGLLRLADRALEQRVFGDDSLARARTALEEALRLAPDDPDGSIHGRLGRVQFLQERYPEAQSNLAVARERDKSSERWAELWERARINASTRASERSMADGRFDAERLLSPPALFLEEPKNLKGPPKVPSRPLLDRVAYRGKAVLGTALGVAIKGGVKVAQATRPDKGPWTSWDLRSYLPGTLQLLGKRMWMNRNILAR